jgi:hypothetical protein
VIGGKEEDVVKIEVEGVEESDSKIVGQVKEKIIDFSDLSI